MPFTRTTACADTCVLSDFIRAGRVELLWQLFPDGIWVDASAVIELQTEFGSAVLDDIRSRGCEPLFERAFEDRHYLEMAEIKRRRPALRHPDIVCVVLAGMHGATCLSSDAAVRKTCQERGVSIAGQLGCLEQAVQRRLISRAVATDLLREFLTNGLYLPRALIADFLTRG